MTSFGRWGKLPKIQRLQALKNGEFGLKVKISKNMPKTSRAFEKILILRKNLKFQKTCQNPLYKRFTVVLCKKPLQKTPNI